MDRQTAENTITEYLGETAISIPTFSNNGIFKTCIWFHAEALPDD